MQVSVDQIMQMPNAAILAKRLETALFEERQKRQHFYEIIVENKKMEFINGEIYFQSPVNLRHSQALKNLLTLLNTFVVRNEAGFVGFEKILVSLTRNDYEPDICFFEKHNRKTLRRRRCSFRLLIL